MFNFCENFNGIKALGERLKGRSYSASEFTKLIRRQFPVTDFVFKTVRDYAVDPDMIIVEGLYDSFNDSQYLPSIEVSICYHPEQEVFFVDNTDWDKLAFDVAECIGHEYVHRSQYLLKNTAKEYVSTKLDPREREEQEYLGNSYEIEAYGFSIAAEAAVYNKPFTKCFMYEAYCRCFEDDKSIIAKLEKQIAKYAKKMESVYEQVT